MSASLWWQRPPVEPERQGATSGTTDSLLYDVLFEGVRETAEAVIERGSPTHLILQGAHAGVDAVAQDDDARAFRDDLERLLGDVEKYGAVHVCVARL